MRRQCALTGLTMMFCALAAAQTSTGDRVVVPARNSSRPRLVKANLMNGSITVKAYAGKEVIVESRGGEKAGGAQTRDGLKRVDLPGSGGLEVTEEDNVITVRADHGVGNLTISVPPDTSLQLKATNGPIEVDGVHGELDVSSRNGRVTLTNVAGTVLADSHNGAVKVVMTRVDAGKPLSFSSYNGDVDVTLPADFKANLKVRADQGDLFSDFDLKLSAGQAVTEKSDAKDSRFRVRTDRTATGTINGGGAEATFTTFNGKIMIRKK
jgi:DUF4097 and DUF4098 domain-containing protein YvlB